MIAKALRFVTRVFGSPKLALTLIILVGAWSMLATIVPQGHLDSREIESWVAGNGLVGSLTSAVGLHEAFSAPAFAVLAALLTLSTAVCSWGRTKVAVKRSRTLRDAARADVRAIAAKHDLMIAIEPGTPDSDALTRAAGALEPIGLKVSADGDVVRAVSPWWSVWGSPVFHWALVLLALAAFAGALFRAEGNMVIPVGQSKPDAPESYLVVETGSWHRWDGAQRFIRVDDFDPAMKKGDLELGAVPTVSVLDADGEVIAHDDVYPNNKLHAGSLSINAPTCGLTATVALTTAAGGALPPVVQLVAFSQEASGGTEPLQPLVASNDAGQVLLRMSTSIPLDPRGDGTYGEWIPREPAAHVVLEDGSGVVLFDGVVRKGESAPLIGGGSVQLLDVGWYAHLAVVDDPSIPVVYAAMLLGMLGLTISLVSRQQLLTAAVIDGEDGNRALAVSLRLWRNSSTDRAEVERVLTEALSTREEGERS
ncbi:MAG: cytochrome c biogenesis protein ResB [Coriobacteriia bacterium]